MKLVLLKDVKHLGKVGDEVNVKGGFARNYLLPSKSALTPTEENLEIISKMKDELMKKEQEAKEAALAIKEKLSGYKQVFKLQVKEDSDEIFAWNVPSSLIAPVGKLICFFSISKLSVLIWSAIFCNDTDPNISSLSSLT